MASGKASPNASGSGASLDSFPFDAGVCQSGDKTRKIARGQNKPSEAEAVCGSAALDMWLVQPTE